MNSATTIQQDNLTLIQEFGEISCDFKSHAKSVSDLFFFYVQDCVLHNKAISLDSHDVYKIKEVINFLENLKYDNNG